MQSSPDPDPMAHINTERVFAIDPTVKGYAFAVFEGPDTLLDWGIVQVSPKEKNRRVLRSIEEKLARYEPSVIVLEDYQTGPSKRWSRVKALLEKIAALGAARHVPCRSISRAQVRALFPHLSKPTRTAIAAAIAERFPEIRPTLPPVHKFWYEAEEERLNIFDAAALAIAYFEGKAGRRKPDPALRS